MQTEQIICEYVEKFTFAWTLFWTFIVTKEISWFSSFSIFGFLFFYFKFWQRCYLLVVNGSYITENWYDNLRNRIFSITGTTTLNNYINRYWCGSWKNCFKAFSTDFFFVVSQVFAACKWKFYIQASLKKITEIAMQGLLIVLQRVLSWDRYS